MKSTVIVKWKRIRRLLSAILLLVCIMGLGMTSKEVQAAKISKKKLTMYIGETKTIKGVGTSKAVRWRSSKKSVVSVNLKGKLTAKKAGKAIVIAKKGKKKYKFIVKVKRPDGAQRLQLAKREAKRIVKKYISKDMNTVERAYVLFRWLSDNCSWQKDQSVSAYKKNYGNEAYAALVMKKAACSGCAKAYTILCKDAHVPVKHVNQNSWTHQWNLVRINGRWMKVDSYGGTFESTKGIRESLLRQETFNEEGKKELLLYSFQIEF